jgi:hypothetical protein
MREVNTNHFMDFNKLDSNGELIIEIQDEMFIVDEDGLRTPIEDDFEYEILVEADSELR